MLPIDTKKSTIYKAFTDVIDSLMRTNVWLHLGWIDIQQKYRGSILGPIWISISMVVFIGALSIVYTRLFNQDIQTFMPFLTAGMLSWLFISTIITESSEVFISSKTLIENFKLPFFIYVLRLIWRNHIVFYHNFVVFLIIALLFKISINLNTLLFIPGFLLVSLLLTNISLIIGLLGTRFRDIPPVVNSVTMVLFFVSPVTWQPDLIGSKSLIILLNPLFYILDLIRSPLLGKTPLFDSWLVVLMLILISQAIAMSFFGKFKNRIAFWV